MVYSARLRSGIGAVQACLNELGLGIQCEKFRKHGEHETDADAPLVLVACSGGRDSMALVALTRKVCASRGLKCGVVIVDHHLQVESTHAAHQAARRCQQLGVATEEIHVVSVHISSQSCKSSGEEAAARQARYDALVRVAQQRKAAAVLLAHTAHDQAETVLMALRDSSGLQAVSGMQPVIMRQGVRFARPLLAITRADTTGICQDLHIDWWDDPTNGECAQQLDESYPLRSRVRCDLLPFMSKFFHTDMVRVLASGARVAQEDLDYIDAQAEVLAQRALQFEDSSCSISSASTSTSTSNPSSTLAPRALLNATILAEAHVALRRRVICKALQAFDWRFSARQVEAIDALIVNWHGQGAVSLPKGYQARRKKSTITIAVTCA